MGLASPAVGMVKVVVTTAASGMVSITVQSCKASRSMFNIPHSRVAGISPPKVHDSVKLHYISCLQHYLTATISTIN